MELIISNLEYLVNSLFIIPAFNVQKLCKNAVVYGKTPRQNETNSYINCKTYNSPPPVNWTQSNALRSSSIENTTEDAPASSISSTVP